MDLISVVVVTYNSSRTVVETLDSIKNQTYQNLELIVSDDDSTDNTVMVVRGWMKKNRKRFSNMRLLLARENHGVTKNGNIAINQAQGKYIQEMAADDILLNHAIERKYQFAEKYSLPAVFCKVEVFGGRPSRRKEMEEYCERGYDVIQRGWPTQYDYIMECNYVAGPSGAFFLSEYIKGIGGYDIRYPYLDDYPFIFHYITAGNELVLLDEVLVRYRMRDDSLCTQKSKPFLKSCAKFFFYKQVKELIKNRKYKKLALGIWYWFKVIVVNGWKE